MDEEGSFMFYYFIVNGRPSSMVREYYGFTQSTSSAADFEVDPLRCYAFHIKNTSPISNTDVLNSLSVSYFLGQPKNVVLAQNLVGSSVDTTNYYFFTGHFTNVCNYSFTKNGIANNSPPDTLLIPSCLDTAIVNIFY